MRWSGVVHDARGLGCHDHLCWVYDDRQQLTSRLREYVSDGLRAGQRVQVVGIPPSRPRHLAQVACMHPAVNDRSTPFRLYAGPTVAGGLDHTSHTLFPTALEWADLRPVEGRLVLDGTRLTFVDHRSLLDLADYASRRGATAVLRTQLPMVSRLTGLLDLRELRVECPL